MHTWPDLGGFHLSFCGFKLSDQLSNFLIETSLEFINSFQQLSYQSYELSVDRNAANDCMEPSHFGQHPCVSQTLQGLFEGKIEQEVSDKQLDIFIINLRDLERRLQIGIHFSGKLQVSNAFCPQLEWHSLVHPILEVGALYGTSFISDLIPKIPALLFLVEP